MTTNKVQQWRDLRFGMFIHFGLYSIAGGVWDGRQITKGYSEQILAHAPVPRTDYENLAKQFNPTAFDPDAIAALAVDAGMKYIIITTKHHDGFCLFHSRHTKYNMVDATPYGKDVVAQLAEACRRRGLKFGVYFSWIDWHYPHALPISDHNSDAIPDKHMAFNLAQVEELMTQYGPIVEVWFDMGAPTRQQSQDMVNLVHRLQPEAMVNGRVWHGLGDFTVLGDNQVPDFDIEGPWQTPASIYHATWGYRSWQERTDLPGKIKDLTDGMKQVRQRGGNYLLNIGPRGDGSIVEFEADVLRGIGQWMRANANIQPAASASLPRVTLKDADARLTYRFAGADYYSNKPITAKKTWTAILPNGEKCEIVVES
ncbi:MAG: alpha-L-fucosidase [Phycisphaeraceae bacterium]|nr:alpha-L-fucosidase [Phycisphaeraceae bacterium]